MTKGPNQALKGPRTNFNGLSTVPGLHG